MFWTVFAAVTPWGLACLGWLLVTERRLSRIEGALGVKTNGKT